jgi:GTPase SAR1 family protein
MEHSPEFVSYKKVIVFGAEGSGKTTLTKSIEKGSFSEETHTENSKHNLY